jgi:light-regulated signal transduction histidine kinase (bacteriophytochrome)
MGAGETNRMTLPQPDSSMAPSLEPNPLTHDPLRSLLQEIGELKAALVEHERLNTELKQRVLDRTADLEAARKELEAFSYSVSHDLRAPLRAVDGFSQALLEDFADPLPEEGRRYLLAIREGAQKMGMLIDDLLMFSHLGRMPLHKQAVDTETLVRGVLDELQALETGREIEAHIGPLPRCSAHPALLRQVWVNLISNALKYTRRRGTARIEMNCHEGPDGVIYQIRDNGTGFDMRYAGKLFGVFQRLHRAEDYEGRGVGLAIAQRVIHRHGGRIWAEAAVDQGAAFFFTLHGKSQS